MTTVNAWPRPWGSTRRRRPAPTSDAYSQELRVGASTAALPLLPASALPDDPGQVLELAARCLASGLVRQYAGARELSDLLAAERVRLPLLNWPTSALPSTELLGVAR